MSKLWSATTEALQAGEIASMSYCDGKPNNPPPAASADDIGNIPEHLRRT